MLKEAWVDQMSRFLSGNREEIGSWLALSLDALKTLSLVAGAVGLFHLVSYLNSVNAPLLITDFGSTLMLVVIAAVYATLASSLLLSLYSPALFCSPGTISGRVIRIEAPMSSSSRIALAFGIIRQTALHHGGAMFALLAFCILNASRSGGGWDWMYYLLGAIVGSLISVYMFSRHTADGRNSPIFFSMPHLEVFRKSMWRAFWTTIWLFLLSLIFVKVLRIGQYSASAFVRDLIWLVFLLFTAAFYLSMTWSQTGPKRTPPAVFLMLVFISLLFPSFVGQRTLHFLGIGGGLPVSILLKTPDTGSTIGNVRTVPACLILNAGSHLVIQPVKNPTQETCAQSQSAEPHSYAAMLKGVQVIAASDVLALSGFSSAATGSP